MALYLEGLSKGAPDKNMAQFQEMMRQQLESSMHSELGKLLDTSTGPEREVSCFGTVHVCLCEHLVVVKRVFPEDHEKTHE